MKSIIGVNMLLGTGHYLCRGGGGEGKIYWKDQNFCKTLLQAR